MPPVRTVPLDGQKLRDLREPRTQADLAKAARITEGYLGNIENNRRDPGVAVATRLAKALGLTLDELTTACALSGDAPELEAAS